jgi:hypothetical protein
MCNAVKPSISMEEAKINSAAYLNIDSKKISDGELAIYPEKETGKLYLCWHIKIIDDKNAKGIMIDAQT